MFQQPKLSALFARIFFDLMSCCVFPSLLDTHIVFGGLFQATIAMPNSVACSVETHHPETKQTSRFNASSRKFQMNLVELMGQPWSHTVDASENFGVQCFRHPQMVRDINLSIQGSHPFCWLDPWKPGRNLFQGNPFKPRTKIQENTQK